MHIERQLIGILSIGSSRPSCVVMEKASDQQLTLRAEVTSTATRGDDRQLWQELLRAAERQANVTIDQLHLDVPLSWMTVLQSKVHWRGWHDKRALREVERVMKEHLQKRALHLCHISVSEPQPLPEGGFCYRVCALAIKNSLHQSLQNMATDMQVRLMSVRSAIYDAANHCAQEHEKKSGVVYIHMNEDGVTYCAFKDNLLRRIATTHKGCGEAWQYLRSLTRSREQALQWLGSFGYHSQDAVGERLRGYLSDMIAWLMAELKTLENDIGSALYWIVAQGETRAQGLLSLVCRQNLRPTRSISDAHPIFSDSMTEFFIMAHHVMGGRLPDFSNDTSLPQVRAASQSHSVFFPSRATSPAQSQGEYHDQ